eukprot:scaffold170928_cov31-Tisochrysis_lutea.AAC.3
MDSGAWKAARERSKRSRCDNVLALSRSGPPRLRSDGIVRMKKPPSPGMNSTLTDNKGISVSFNTLKQTACQLPKGVPRVVLREAGGRHQGWQKKQYARMNSWR